MTEWERYESVGVRLRLREIVRLQMAVKKHFAYIDAIGEARGDRSLVRRLGAIASKIESLKKSLDKYRKAI